MTILAFFAIVLFGIAVYHLSCAIVDVPTSKTSRMMMLSRKQQGIKNEKLLDVYATKVAGLAAPYLRLDKLKRIKGDEQFDYLSIDDFRIIRNQLFENKKRSTKDRYPIPFAIFTDPPLAHIGLTEEEAMKNGYSIHVARIPAAMIPRARTLHSIDGMLKAIVDIHTGRILGCTLLCADAPEVINTVASIMKTGQRYHFLRDFIFTHPSMNEGLNMLFKPF